MFPGLWSTQIIKATLALSISTSPSARLHFPAAEDTFPLSIINTRYWTLWILCTPQAYIFIKKNTILQKDTKWSHHHSHNGGENKAAVACVEQTKVLKLNVRRSNRRQISRKIYLQSWEDTQPCLFKGLPPWKKSCHSRCGLWKRQASFTGVKVWMSWTN